MSNPTHYKWKTGIFLQALSFSSRSDFENGIPTHLGAHLGAVPEFLSSPSSCDLSKSGQHYFQDTNEINLYFSLLLNWQNLNPTTVSCLDGLKSFQILTAVPCQLILEKVSGLVFTTIQSLVRLPHHSESFQGRRARRAQAPYHSVCWRLPLLWPCLLLLLTSSPTAYWSPDAVASFLTCAKPLSWVLCVWFSA